MRPPTRKALETDLVNATLLASGQILSCIVINHILRLPRLKNNIISTIIAAVVIASTAFFSTWLINLVGREPDSLRDNWPLAIPAFLTGLAFFVVKTLHDSLLPSNRGRAAKLPTSPDGIKALCDWFKKSFGISRQVLFSTIIGMLAVFTVRILSNSFPIFLSNTGFYASVFIGMFAIGNGVYCALIIPTLASTAGQHRMNLFPYNPASTTVVKIASAGFGKLALANGLVSTLVIALIFAFRPWQDTTTFRFAFAWLIFGWGIAVYSFVFPQYHISKIIVREKQFEIEHLEAIIANYHSNFEKLTEKEMDKLSKIIELREKVSNSPDTAVSLRGWSDFIGSLVLPLISFIAGVVDIPKILGQLFS